MAFITAESSTSFVFSGKNKINRRIESERIPSTKKTVAIAKRQSSKKFEVSTIYVRTI